MPQTVHAKVNSLPTDLILMNISSAMFPVLMQMKNIVPVQLDNPATSAKSRKKTAAMEVCLLLLHVQLLYNVYFTGCHRPWELPIKEETKPPVKSTTKKCKVYSTTDVNPVSMMDMIDVDFESAQPVGKCSKFAAGPSQVCFNRVTITRQMRKSKHSTSTKATTTKELFECLAQDYSVIAKASERIAEICK